VTLKHRLIPVLLLQNGLLVRSERFTIHQVIGNPINEVRRFNEWNVDELIYLDITQADAYDIPRSDHKIRAANDPLDLLALVSRSCFMPLTWGGRIRSVDDMAQRFRRGADKVSINSAAFRDPSLITDGARAFGSQAIVVSIDVSTAADGREVVIDGARTRTGRDPVEWAKEVEGRGAGEILLQLVERDGSGLGYDLGLIAAVSGATSIPVIACSGVGTYEHYVQGIRAGADAVAAANIWHFKELSDRNAKRVLSAAGVSVRL
jgi:imidazole glycerol-phosphate synthase subunit HisF